MTNQISKSNLAKLLATENINVEYRKTDTASFNVKSRTLTLPIWNDMTPEMHDLLIGHEVGHALDTPKEYGDFGDYGKGFQSFLNVVEDARIERLIKDRYPGLKRQFSKGYQDFIGRDFFKTKGKDISKFLLIDRINLYYKIGPFFPVKFNETETEFLRKIDTVQTFDDVIAVSKELYDYCKQELEDKRHESMKDFHEKVANGEFDDKNDKFDDKFGDNDFENEGEDINPNSYDDNFGEDYQSDEAKGHDYQYSDPKELEQYDELKSVTDENLQHSLRQLTETKEVFVGNATDISDWNYDKLIVGYKELLDKILSSEYEHSTKELTEFETRTKNSVSYLVKEFELRKKAAELRRVTISDTGVLDTNKLHTYKFNDDIFRKIGSVSAGKNHGVVMFVDWSGSMCENMAGTIEQLITLTTFCRKVNVPFEVYAFSNQYYRVGSHDGSGIVKINEGTIDVREKFNLLNLLSSKMRNQEYRKMANDLLNYGNYINNYLARHRIHDMMHLGGTPLNATILASGGIVNRFRKAYKAEIVDVIFLTDGDDASTLWTKSDFYNTRRIGPSNQYTVSYIMDKETNKKYRVESQGVTPILLQILKDRTDCNLIGFFIAPKQRRHFESIIHRMELTSINLDESYLKFKHDKFFMLTNYGYDRYFLIPGGSELSVDDDDLDDLLGKDNKEVSTRKLKGAFLKMNQNRLTNRVLLTKVIEGLA